MFRQHIGKNCTRQELRFLSLRPASHVSEAGANRNANEGGVRLHRRHDRPLRGGPAEETNGGKEARVVMVGFSVYLGAEKHA